MVIFDSSDISVDYYAREVKNECRGGGVDDETLKVPNIESREIKHRISLGFDYQMMKKKEIEIV